MSRFAWLFCFALLYAPQSAWANDSTFGGTGADLVPVEESRVTMKSEDIVLEYVGDSWRIRADYVFENLAAQSIQLQVGFPEMKCPEYDDCDSRFWDMQTTVDGAPVQHRKGTIASQHEWARRLGTVWLFDVVFPAAQEVRIRHTYHMTSHGSVDAGAGTTYVVRTGATWAGNIGRASFTAKLPAEAHTVVSNWGKPEFVGLDAHHRPFVQLSKVEMEWVPAEDLYLEFHYSAVVPPELGADRLKRSGVPSGDECREFPAPATLAQLQMCKNLLFAISGYVFQDERLQRYFYGRANDWEQRATEANGSERQETWVRGLRPLPSFNYAAMPEQNRWFLDYLERQVRPGLQAATAQSPATSSSAHERTPTWKELKAQQRVQESHHEAASGRPSSAPPHPSHNVHRAARPQEQSAARSPAFANCVCSLGREHGTTGTLALLALVLLSAGWARRCAGSIGRNAIRGGTGRGARAGCRSCEASQSEVLSSQAD